MLLLLSTFLVIYTEQYLNEKRIVHQTQIILRQEYYFLHSVRKLENQLQNGETISITGVFILQDGKADYIKEDLGTSFKITFTITLNSGEKALGFAYYDKNLKRVTKWVERN